MIASCCVLQLVSGSLWLGHFCVIIGRHFDHSSLIIYKNTRNGRFKQRFLSCRRKLMALYAFVWFLPLLFRSISKKGNCYVPDFYTVNYWWESKIQSKTFILTLRLLTLVQYTNIWLLKSDSRSPNGPLKSCISCVKYEKIQWSLTLNSPNILVLLLIILVSCKIHRLSWIFDPY